ncbi:hypothetical protein [Sphingomonas paucimobilis]|uniref:hypothetical protein n=1 Tax=Sphingomonas paucimobilis TaxID=13689 RepID=UPI001E655C43|nr:hypothetical protein [Sphingomonas paucimobilis]
MARASSASAAACWLPICWRLVVELTGTPLALIGGTTISPATSRVAEADPPPTRAIAMPRRCWAWGVRVSFNSSLSCAIVSAWAGGAGGFVAFSPQPASRIGIRKRV